MGAGGSCAMTAPYHGISPPLWTSASYVRYRESWPWGTLQSRNRLCPQPFVAQRELAHFHSEQAAQTQWETPELLTLPLFDDLEVDYPSVDIGCSSLTLPERSDQQNVKRERSRSRSR